MAVMSYFRDCLVHFNVYGVWNLLHVSGVVFTVDSSVPEGVSDLIQQSGGTVKRAITAATKYLISTIVDIAAGSSKVRWFLIQCGVHGLVRGVVVRSQPRRPRAYPC